MNGRVRHVPSLLSLPPSLLPPYLDRPLLPFLPPHPCQSLLEGDNGMLDGGGGAQGVLNRGPAIFHAIHCVRVEWREGWRERKMEEGGRGRN